MKFFISAVLIFVPCLSTAFPLTDARNLALGGMVVSSSDIESAPFVNPAVLGQAQNLVTSFSQARLSADSLDFGGSLVFPLVKDQVGVGFGADVQVIQNQIQYAYVRDSNGQYVVDPATGMPLTQVLGFFTQSSNVFYGSLGIRLGSFCLGASAKYFLSDFGSLEGKGWGLDLGLNVILDQDLFLGTSLYDLQDSSIRYDGSVPDQVLPAFWTSSFAWYFWRNDSFSFLVEPGISSRWANLSDLNWGVGIEGSWKKCIYLRFGANQNQVSLGTGIVVHPGKVFSEVRIDYTYLGGNTNDFPSRLTLTTTW